MSDTPAKRSLTRREVFKRAAVAGLSLPALATLVAACSPQAPLAPATVAVAPTALPAVAPTLAPAAAGAKRGGGGTVFLNEPATGATTLGYCQSVAGVEALADDTIKVTFKARWQPGSLHSPGPPARFRARLVGTGLLEDVDITNFVRLTHEESFRYVPLFMVTAWWRRVA